MHETPAQRALTTSTAALVIAMACLAMFVPPLVQHTVNSVLRTVLVALTLASSLLVHWVFLAVAARRLGRSVGGWVALSLLLLPVGSVAALMLLNGLRDEAEAPATAG
jgi:hypothetical protein